MSDEHLSESKSGSPSAARTSSDLLKRLLTSRSIIALAGTLLGAVVLADHQIARFLLLATASTYFFSRVARPPNTKWDVGGYIVTSVFLVHVHFLGVLLLLAQNVRMFAIVPRRQTDGHLTLRRWLEFQVLVGMGVLPAATVRPKLFTRLALQQELLVVLWGGIFLALLVVGLPIASKVFAPLSSKGAGYALPLSMTILTAVSYWVGHFQYGLLSMSAALLVLAALSIYFGRDGSELDLAAIGETVCVFLFAYLLMITILAAAPGVDPFGEAFHDYGQFKTLLRSVQLPPEDVWFAGESVPWYYGGFVSAAFLTDVTGTEPRYAYNLALAGFYAMLVTAAYETAASVARHRGYAHHLAGAASAFFVGFSGNLFQLLVTLVWALPSPFDRRVENAVSGSLRPEAACVLGDAPTQVSYFNAARIIPETLNVFPILHWFTGELHPNLMSTPFLLLGVGILYSYYRAPAANRRVRRGLLFLALPLVIGFVAAVNTWDVATIFGMAVLTLVFAPTDPISTVWNRSGRDGSPNAVTEEVVQFARAIPPLALIGATSVLVALPFLLQTASGRSLALVPAARRSTAIGLLLVHGTFLVVFGIYFLARLKTRDRRTSLALVALAVPWLALVAGPIRYRVVGLFVPFLVVAWYLRQHDRELGFETVLVIGGLGLVLIVEFVYVVEDAAAFRYNTVYKFYVHVWLLWGVAAGVLLPRLARGRFATWSIPTRRRQQLGVLFAVCLLLSGGLFATVAWSNRAAGYQTPSLDAMRYAESEHPEETEAIRWLDERSGTPTLVSAPGETRYIWEASPAASLTGVPTFVGWLHEGAYRTWSAYYGRQLVADTIFNGSSPEQRKRLLLFNDIDYIYVGPGERARYDDVEPFTFDGVSVAFRNDAVTIYRVDHSRLAANTELDAGGVGGEPEARGEPLPKEDSACRDRSDESRELPRLPNPFGWL